MVMLRSASKKGDRVGHLPVHLDTVEVLHRRLVKALNQPVVTVELEGLSKHLLPNIRRRAEDSQQLPHLPLSPLGHLKAMVLLIHLNQLMMQVSLGQNTRLVIQERRVQRVNLQERLPTSCQVK